MSVTQEDIEALSIIHDASVGKEDGWVDLTPLITSVVSYDSWKHMAQMNDWIQYHQNSHGVVRLTDVGIRVLTTKVS